MSDHSRLAHTRPEKSEAMTRLVYAIREVTVEPARNGDLNIAEVINAFGQVLASILVGAYDPKNREVVVSTFPDLVRAYYPHWEKIYAAHDTRAGDLPAEKAGRR